MRLLGRTTLKRFVPRIRFSLRTLMILIAALAVWLGVRVERARKQALAVGAIQASGGLVLYEFEYAGTAPFSPRFGHRTAGGNWAPPEAKCLIDLLGVDFFHCVEFA